MRRPAWRLPAALALVSCLTTCAAWAHKASDSYLSLMVDGARIDGRWDIALRDLDNAIGLDADGDGAITWGELRARHADIAAYALARLALAADGAACGVAAGEQLVDDHTDGAYTVLRFTAICPRAASTLGIDYRLFADIDPQHRGLLNLAAGGQARTAVFSPQAARQSFALAAQSRWAQFAAYAEEGVLHIWAGTDHILFLLSLLLPAVLVWQGRGWRPVATFREAFVDVVKIVTSFTLAHSITLSLATLQVVALPSRWVEASIAASVVAAALNNVRPLVHGRRWVVAFAFGLVHGFGFASVLSDLGLPQGALALALVGFNVGVEIGQLAIVGVFLPLAYALRRTAFYRRALFVGGSLAIAVVAGIWLAERVFDFKWLPI